MELSGKRLVGTHLAQLEKWLGERRQFVAVLETEESIQLMKFARMQLETGIGSAISPAAAEHLQRAASLRTTIQVLEEFASRRGDIESGAIIT